MLATAEGLEAGVLVWVSAVAVRRLPFPVVWGALRDLPAGPGRTAPGRLGRRIERIGSRLRGGEGCFPQAIASFALCRRHGHRPALVIGVKTRPFGAHAWVEVDGLAVTGGTEARHYQEIWRGQA